VFEGNENDVLDRYYNCAKKNKSDIIVRITGDCPITDASIVDSLINTLINDKLDFVSNWSPPTFPDGLDVSVCTYNALRKAWNLSTSKYDREHVMPYFVKKNFFKIKNISYESNVSAERWTLDWPEDLIVLKKIFTNFKKNYIFSWKEVLKLKKKHPEYFEANKHITRNEGGNLSDSQKMWQRAKKIIPGGNMLLSKRPELYLPTKWPTYFSKSKGSKIWDLDKKKYLDMSMMGIGTNILGYNNIEVDTAVKKNIDKGNLTTLNAPEEVFLSEKLISMHPWAGMAKFTRSGGEASAVAIRIARAATKKNKVAICGYHGWHDWYLAANLDGRNKLDSHHIKGLNPLGVPKNLSGSILLLYFFLLRLLLFLLLPHSPLHLI
jgi:glutamate-1-semialdehyde 2,1-aminomutase